MLTILNAQAYNLQWPCYVQSITLSKEDNATTAVRDIVKLPVELYNALKSSFTRCVKWELEIWNSFIENVATNEWTLSVAVTPTFSIKAINALEIMNEGYTYTSCCCSWWCDGFGDGVPLLTTVAQVWVIQAGEVSDLGSLVELWWRRTSLKGRYPSPEFLYSCWFQSLCVFVFCHVSALFMTFCSTPFFLSDFLSIVLL